MLYHRGRVGQQAPGTEAGLKNLPRAGARSVPWGRRRLAARGGPQGPPGQPNKKREPEAKASGSRFSGREAPRRRPGAHPTVTCYPAPACIRRQYGGYPGGAGRPERTCGGRRRSGAGAKGPGPRTCPLPGLPGSGRVGVAHPPPPSAGFSTNAKKATKKPGPTIYGAWPMKPCQEGARQRLHPLGKAAAHALRAAAASSACRGLPP